MQVLSVLSSEVEAACDQFLKSIEDCVEQALALQELTSNLKPLPLKELYAPKKGGE